MRRRRDDQDAWLLALLPLALAALGVWMSPWLLPMHAALDMHQMALAWAGVVAAFLLGRGRGGAAGAVAALIAIWLAVWPTGLFGIALGAVWRYLLLIAVFGFLVLRDVNGTAFGPSPRMSFWTVLLLALIMSRLLLWGYY
jgi:hypothetical protein